MDIENEKQIAELNSQGARLHLQGKLRKAADCYRQALNLDSENATSHNNLGFLLAQQHQWKEALKHLTIAVELSPENANFLSNLAQVLVKTGAVQEGLDMLLKAAELDSNSLQVWENLGRLYSNLDDFADAEIAWRQAWRLAKLDVRIIAELASTIALQNRLPEAIALYKQALDIHPGFADGWVQLGVSQFLQQHYTEARESLEKALSLDAANYSALRHIAYVYMSLGDRGKSLESFKTLLNYYPAADPVRLDLAILHLAGGQYQAAREHLEFLYKNNRHSDRIVFYYGLSLYHLDNRARAYEIWSALQNSDSPYRSKLGEFVKD